MQDLASKINTKTRAVLATHFFGVQFDFSDLRAACSEQNLALIEDCAHTMFGLANCGAIGSYGDYAIASPRKFLPIQDGGIFHSREGDYCAEPKPPGLRKELKALVNALEYSSAYGRLGLLGSVVSLAIRARAKLSSGTGERWSAARRQDDVGAIIEKDVKHASAIEVLGLSHFSLRVINSLSIANVIAARRRNYDFMLDQLSSLAHGTPFLGSLPPEAVPYVFVMEIDKPHITHAKLRQAGVPVWRWDELDTDVCAWSNRLSQSLIQLPCHQSLSHNELCELTSRIRNVLIG